MFKKLSNFLQNLKIGSLIFWNLNVAIFSGLVVGRVMRVFEADLSIWVLTVCSAAFNVLIAYVLTYMLERQIKQKTIGIIRDKAYGYSENARIDHINCPIQNEFGRGESLGRQRAYDRVADYCNRMEF